jgi:hypothetical protein
MKNNKIMDFWIFDSEPIKDLYIYDYGSKEKRPYYYLVFLTSRNVYFSRMEKNFEDQGFQIKKTVVTNFDEKNNRGSIVNNIPKGKIKVISKLFSAFIKDVTMKVIKDALLARSPITALKTIKNLTGNKGFKKGKPTENNVPMKEN